MDQGSTIQTTASFPQKHLSPAGKALILRNRGSTLQKESLLPQQSGIPFSSGPRGDPPPHITPQTALFSSQTVLPRPVPECSPPASSVPRIRSDSPPAYM